MDLEGWNVHVHRSSKGTQMSEFAFGYIELGQVSTYKVMDPLLASLYAEFSELSKKKPQDVLSSNKVNLVNRVMVPILEMLDKEPMRSFLDLLNDEDLPQNSDVILMLGQCRAAMATFKNRHFDLKHGWHVEV